MKGAPASKKAGNLWFKAVIINRFYAATHFATQFKLTTLPQISSQV